MLLLPPPSAITPIHNFALSQAQHPALYIHYLMNVFNSLVSQTGQLPFYQ